MSDELLQKDAQKVASLDLAISQSIENRLKGLHTACPGIITGFNASTQTATVQPAIKMVMVDGKNQNLPLCLDVPVHVYQGGKFAITMPVTAGDECLLVFGERCIDGWFSGGSTSLPEDYRMHDYSDGFAIVGFSSNPKKISAYSTNSAQLRLRDGSAHITLFADGSIQAKTPGGDYKMSASGAMEINAPQGTVINSPHITLNGNTQVIGNISGGAGNGGNGSAQFDGTLNASQDVVGGGISLKSHRHSGVKAGPDNTGNPI